MSGVYEKEKTKNVREMEKPMILDVWILYSSTCYIYPNGTRNTIYRHLVQLQDKQTAPSISSGGVYESLFDTYSTSRGHRTN